MPTPIKEEPEEPCSNSLENQSTSIQPKTEPMEDEKPSELQKLLMAAPAKPKEIKTNVGAFSMLVYPRCSVGVQCKPKTAEKSTNYIARKIGPLKRLVPKSIAVTAKSELPPSSGKGATDVEEDNSRCKECGFVVKGYQWWCLQCCVVRCAPCAQRAAHRAHIVLRVPLAMKQPHEVIAVIKQHIVNDFEQNDEDDDMDSDNLTGEPLFEDRQTLDDSSDQSDESDQPQHSGGSDYSPDQSDVDSQDSGHRDFSDVEGSKVRPPRRKRSRIQATNRKKGTVEPKSNRPQPSTSDLDLGTTKQKNVLRRAKQKKVEEHSREIEEHYRESGEIIDNTNSSENKGHHNDNTDNISESTPNSEGIDYENIEYLSDIEELS